MTIAKTIRMQRGLRNWTQRKLAELLGVSPGAVSQYESGLCMPSAQIILRLIYDYGFDFENTSDRFFLTARQRQSKVAE